MDYLLKLCAGVLKLTLSLLAVLVGTASKIEENTKSDKYTSTNKDFW